jgi:hypothetical protein
VLTGSSKTIEESCTKIAYYEHTDHAVKIFHCFIAVLVAILLLQGFIQPFESESCCPNAARDVSRESLLPRMMGFKLRQE